MRNIKIHNIFYLYKRADIFLLLLGVLLWTSCIKDDFKSTPVVNGEVILNVKLPKPIISSTTTRAGAIDFDIVNDLNIIIAAGSNEESDIQEIFYLPFNDEASVILPDGVTFVSQENNSYSLHFSAKYLEDKGYVASTIYVVANYGSSMQIKGPHNVGELQRIKEETSSLSGIISGNSMLFAKAIENETHTDADGTVGKTLKAELQRLAALVTVRIDGSGLKDDVIITPTRIQLHRVPKECFIGQPNIDLNASTDIVQNGEFKETASYKWSRVANEATVEKYKEQFSNLSTHSGKHYFEGNSWNEGIETNYTDQDVASLFLFENTHHEDFGAAETNQKYKRPAAATGITPKEIDAAAQNCSYLEVSANYLRYKNDGEIISGPVSFRIFLGGDVISDFDVIRNHYYAVTLSLSGYAVTEGGQIDPETGELETNSDDITWRMETELGEASFVSGDINVNASGEYIPIEVMAGENTTYTISGSGDYFLWVYDPDSYNKTGWESVAGGSDLKATNGILWIYAQPMVPESGDTATSRSCKVTISVNGKEIQTIEIKQYAPIVYDVPDDLANKIFGHTNISILIDRVDRQAMPWGFKGEVLDKNVGFDATYPHGYANCFHLIDQAGGCEHYKVAQSYLPWGKENGGSAMVYAMTFYGLPEQAPSGNIDDLLNDHSLPNLSATPSYTDYFWTLPAIAEWQMIEKAWLAGSFNVADAEPLHDFMEYWTSDAVSLVSDIDGGDEKAYTYQIGRDLHSLSEDDTYPENLIKDRDTPLRFRLIAVKKN